MLKAKRLSVVWMLAVLMLAVVPMVSVVGCQKPTPPPEEKALPPEEVVPPEAVAPPEAVTPPEEVMPPVPEREAKSWEQVFEDCKDAAVDVYILTPTADPNVFGAVVGSGTIINEAGYVLTNCHVVQAEGRRVVGLADGTMLPWRVIGKNSAYDLAIIKIDADRKFTPVGIGRSGDLKIGDPVIAIGNPGKPHQVTHGKVLSPDEAWGYEWGDGGTWFPSMIKTDAQIVGGYSGGPLINQYSEVVGTSCGSMGNIAGFAIPVDTMKRVLPEILAVADSRGFTLGMTVAGLGPGTVIEVTPGSPADAAGVKPGDLVKSVNGAPVTVGFDFYLPLLESNAGDVLHLALDRNGAAMEKVVTLGTVPMLDAVEPPEGVANGVMVEYFQGEWPKLPDFDRLQPSQVGMMETIDFGPFKGQDAFGLRFKGYILVPADGVYAFYLASDDGSRMWIGDKLLIDNDGLHGTVTRRAFVSLKAGAHPFTIAYFDRGGGDSLFVKYEGPGIEKQPIPNSALMPR